MSKRFHILMADVVASSKRNQVKLQHQFRSLINSVNHQYSQEILSPYTITLGDEFQGIARSLKAAIRCIFFLEEEIIRKSYTFKLRYVLYWGEIKTPINKKIAYEMLGPGLTAARRLLTSKSRPRPRFIIRYAEPQLSGILTDLFFVLQHIIDRWKFSNFDLIKDMLAISSNTKLGMKRGKDRTLIWRRRQSLRVEEYLRLKNAIVSMTELVV